MRRLHPVFCAPRPVYYSSWVHQIDGYTRIMTDGGLTYPEADKRPSAWAGGYNGPGGTPSRPADWSQRWQEFVPSMLDRFADSIDSPLFVLNVEHLPSHRLGRIVDILEHIRARRPDVALGVWSIVPQSSWWRLQEYAQFIDWQAGNPHINMSVGWWRNPAVGPARVKAFEDWQDSNDLLAAKLLPHVDFLAPSVYPVLDVAAERPAWTLGREPGLMIAECRRLAPLLPVLPFYYPFISSNKKPASAELNKTILGACRTADGVIVWGDANVAIEQMCAALEVA